MGTRSLTRIFDEQDKELVCIYRQMDGYPSGMGAYLARILETFTLVRGIRMGEKRRVANGYGCLAAQVVKELKDGAGSIYLYPPGSFGYGEEYEYHIKPERGTHLDPAPATIAVFAVVYPARHTKKLFECAPDEYEKVLMAYTELTKEEV